MANEMKPVAFIFVERGKLRGKSLPLHENGTIRVGREAQCQVRLRDRLVSRLHCIFRGEAGKWTVEDCQSSNRTFVNGKPVGVKELVPGDVIQIGETVFSYVTSKTDPLTGEHVAGFLIERCLARGAMGTVYRARQVSLQREVALKVLSRESAAKPGFVDRFVREAQAAARFNHPNVVQVYDAGSEGETYYIAMEYLPGGTLHDILMEKGKVEYHRAVEIICEALKAVSFAEEKGLVHCDLKPANLLFAAGGQTKVADLGIAFDLKDPLQIASGEAAGTPGYMAPEQIRGRDIDNRADIYALGATLFHAVCGEPPFVSTNLKEVLATKLRNDPPLLKERTPQIPRRLSETVARMIARDKNDRFGTAEAASNALKASLSVPAPPAKRSPRYSHFQSGKRTRSSARSSSRSFSLPTGIAVFVFMIIAALIVYSITQRENGTGGAKRIREDKRKTASDGSGEPDRSFAKTQFQKQAPSHGAASYRNGINVEEELTKAEEEKHRGAAEKRAGEIREMIRKDRLLQARAAISDFPYPDFVVDYVPPLEKLLQKSITDLVEEKREEAAALCKKCDFTAARNVLEDVLSKLPPDEAARCDAIRSVIEQSEKALLRGVEQLTALRKEAFRRISRLQFSGLRKPFETLASERPCIAEKAEKATALMQTIKTAWQALTEAFSSLEKKRTSVTLSFSPNPAEDEGIKPARAGRYRISEHKDRYILLQQIDGERQELLRRILGAGPEILLKLVPVPEGVEPESFKEGLGLLFLLRCGMEAAEPLLPPDTASGGKRTGKEDRFAGLNNYWFPARFEELQKRFTQVKKLNEDETAPYKWEYLAREAAFLLAACRGKSVERKEEISLLSGLYLTARSRFLVSGSVDRFFHAQTCKHDKEGYVKLIYDFSKQDQLKDFHAQDDPPAECRFLKEKKAFSLQGEVRFLQGDPFETALSVQGTVLRASPSAPNISVALWTSPKDQVTVKMKDFDFRNFRNRTLRPFRADYIAFSMGLYINLDTGGFAGKGMEKLIRRFRSFLPRYLREPSFVLFSGEEGKTVGGNEGKVLWEMPSAEKAGAPLKYAVMVKDGRIKWAINGRLLSLKTSQRELTELKNTLHNKGSATLFTNGSTVTYGSLQINGKLSETWAAEEAKRIAQEELTHLVEGETVRIPKQP